jgi:hypothetical protein
MCAECRGGIGEVQAHFHDWAFDAGWTVVFGYDWLSGRLIGKSERRSWPDTSHSLRSG